MQLPAIRISLSRQSLELEGPGLVFPVSTSRFGVGNEPESFKTPPGRFEIAEKIGDGAPAWSVFKSREPTGELGDPGSLEDLVQTRILWLHGLDPENARTRERYIYIHGTNHEAEIGTPASHGCIRMRNADIIELYDLVAVGTPVFIQP